MRRASAFTLLELLIVVSLIAIFASMVVPPAVSMLQARSVELAGALVADAVATARQEAVAGNRTVELRLYRSPSGSGDWQALQLWASRGAGEQPVTRLQRFPDGVAVWLPHSPLVTTLLTNPAFRTLGTTNPALAGGSVDYVSVQFRASGALDGSVSTNGNFITLVPRHETNASSPANYAAVLINPATGKPTVIRP